MNGAHGLCPTCESSMVSQQKRAATAWSSSTYMTKGVMVPFWPGASATRCASTGRMFKLQAPPLCNVCSAHAHKL